MSGFRENTIKIEAIRHLGIIEDLNKMKNLSPEANKIVKSISEDISVVCGEDSCIYCKYYFFDNPQCCIDNICNFERWEENPCK